MTTPFRLIRSTGSPRSKKKNVRPDAPRQQKARLGIEWLEDRAVPATFTVNSLQDVSSALDGLMTLREAIDGANGTTEADTIKFAAGLSGTINLSIAGVGEEENKGGDLDVRGSVTIEGPGANVITVNQTVGDRVFDVVASKGAVVNISGLTLTGGNVTADGGGVRNMNGADLTLSQMEIAGNIAAGTGVGGGVATGTGSLAVVSSAVSENSASQGGGVQVVSGDVEIKETTVTNNTATDSGGGVNVSDSSKTSVVVRDSTISSNTAPATQGAGINAPGGNVTLIDSVVDGNIGNDITVVVRTIGQSSSTGNPFGLLPGTVLSSGVGSPSGAASFLNPTLAPLASERSPGTAKPPVENSTAASAAGRLTSDARSTARIVRSPMEVAPTESGRGPEQVRPERTETAPTLTPVIPAAPDQRLNVDPALPPAEPTAAEAVFAAVMNMIARDGARAGVSVIAMMDIDGDGVKEVVLALTAAGGEQSIVVLNGTTGAPVFFVPAEGAGSR
jgi:hypothetical protein